MPSLIVTANTDPDEAIVAAERENAVHYPKSVTVDNSHAGSVDQAIIIRDDFSTDQSSELAADPKEIPRWRATILAGDVVTFNEQDLKGVKCLGALKVMAGAVDESCHITVGYETE